MDKVLIKNIVGPYCGTYDDGAKVYRFIYSLLKEGKQLDLDFTGIEVTSSSFFNAAIGNLLQEFGDKDSRLPITFSNLKPRDQFILERTLDAAKSGDVLTVNP